LDQDTRRQITWIIVAAAILSVVVLVAYRQTEVDSLLKVIAEQPQQARVRAVRALIEQQKLAEALEDRPRWVQDRTVEAAAALGTEHAIEQLVAIKPVVDAPVAERIDAYLTSLGVRAVGPLVIAIQDKDSAVRGAAGGPLKTIGEPAVVSLMPLLEVYDDGVRGLVATTLGGIGEPAVKPLLRVLKQEKPMPEQGPAAFRRSKLASVAAFKAMAAVALDPMIAVLTDEDSEVRLNATDVIGAVAAPLDVEVGVAAVPPLLDRLKNDPEWAVRRKAASAIGGLGETALAGGAAQPLIASLSDSRPEVRAAAAQALGAIGDPVAAAPLANLLMTNRVGATAEIAGALEKLGTPAIAPLTPALKSPELDVRLTATQTLATIGTPQAVEPLGVALADPEVKVRRAAASALRNLADMRVLPALANALGDQESAVYYAARDALARLGAPAVPVLLQRLGSADTRVAYTAQQALARIGEAAIAPLVTGMRTAPSDEVARWAAVALGRIGPTAVEPTAALLADGDASVRARSAAARALGVTGSKQATLPLTKALQGGSPEVREAAIRAISAIGDAAATDALVATLGDDVRQVRETAMDHLIDWRLGDVDGKLSALLQSADHDAARRAAIILAEHTPQASGELIREVGASQEDSPGDSDSVRERLERTAADAGTDREIRLMAIAALRWVGTENSLDTLAPLVSLGSDYAPAASRTIGQIGRRISGDDLDTHRPGVEVQPSRATNLLLGVLDTATDDDLRIIAGAGLSYMGAQPVQALIERLRRTSDPQQRAWLAGILAAIGKPAVDPILDARGRAEDRNLRVWLASSLTIIGDAKALDLIKQLPRDEQPTPETTEATREIFIRIQQYV